jgi:hypothetical protein
MEKLYLILRFLFNLNFVFRYVILRIWSLRICNFAQILNKFLYHFSVKINSLSHVTCV